jgi:hypothetical protein
MRRPPYPDFYQLPWGFNPGFYQLTWAFYLGFYQLTPGLQMTYPSPLLTGDGSDDCGRSGVGLAVPRSPTTLTVIELASSIPASHLFVCS